MWLSFHLCDTYIIMHSPWLLSTQGTSRPLSTLSRFPALDGSIARCTVTISTISCLPFWELGDFPIVQWFPDLCLHLIPIQSHRCIPTSPKSAVNSRLRL